MATANFRLVRLPNRRPVMTLTDNCEAPWGCDHAHPSTNGVRFVTVRVDGAPTKLCGGDWEALREKAAG